ncbi:MAG: hemolysin III family protein [Oscillospiraceae bacterium]|nr:hemolysin III family protein [Oscillospiraceae bacterium]
MTNVKRYSLGEEIFNSVSHGIGALLSVAGCVVLIVLCAIHGGAMEVVSASVYGASLIILYTMSTLYHAITNEKAKRVFRILDHDTIYLLIAGTYTPITLCILHGALGWVIFGLIWASAIIGTVLSSVNLEKFRKISTVCYIAMGWGIILAIKPLIESCTMISIVFLIAGGLCYSGGVLFYIKKKNKYFHSILHLFLISGSVFHYFSIVNAIV